MQVGIGSSEEADAHTAGQSAARTAVTSLNGESVALVLVYASVRYPLPELLAGVRAVTGAAPLAGASSCGQFHQGEIIQPGSGVVVVALTAGDYRFGVACVDGLAADAAAAGQQLVRAAREDAGPDLPQYGTLLLFSDGLAAADQQALLSGVYRVTGASVPVVGGGASDDRKLAHTFVLYHGEAHQDAAVGVWIAAPRPLKVVSAHGWQSNGLPMLVTRVEGRQVLEIGGRPAIDVFREHFRDQPPNNNVEWPVDYYSAHAFGLVDPDGTQVVRGAYVDEAGALNTFAPLPQFSAVQVVSCNPDHLLRISDEIIEQAIADTKPSVILTFSCVGRLDILGDRAGEEAKRLQAAAGDIPTVGFFTYGEFARMTSVAGYHNATVTALAL